ncbi:potassium transporter TrkG [Candidatus Mycoplasma haematohominis]|uniref:TrkH family potassium uptake protein n=1 Tax=Candidatus Mycoplasma haematohominis TaxID=1494318 RepID=UPI001C0A685F
MQSTSGEGKQFYKSKSWFGRLIGNTIYQKTLRIYFLTILIGSVFLYLPFSHKNPDPSKFNFFDAFFTAISAFTNTGLSSHTTSSTFNFFGQLVLLILIQAGGIGFLTIVIFLWAILRKKRKITVEHRLFLHWERGSYNKVESLPSVKTGIIVLLIAELIGAIILFFYFLIVEPDNPNKSNTNDSKYETVNTRGDFFGSLWMGVFHAVSSANNAGFDILGSHSIIPYRTDAKNLLSVVLWLESIVGGIGYPVFHDVWYFYKKKKRGEVAHFSLFTKIGISTYIFIAVLGAWLGVISEVSFAGTQGIFKARSISDGDFGWGKNETANKIWNIIYLTFSSRSSGFSPIDTSELAETTKWLLSILMFIGASPASTGGGIRTITIFIIFARMFYTAIGKKHLSVFYKTIDQSIVYEACNVFVLSTILVVGSIFFLVLAGNHNSVGDSFFESTSAFGTAGLTIGITKKSNFLGRIVLMFLMFVGQLGVSNAVLSITDLKPKSKNQEYCSENLRIV